MKITFLGAAKTVTGSCYLVETARTAFLVDCGMYQGPAHEESRNHAPWPFRMEDVDFVLLTHAHIDHSGRLPKLYVDGYRGPVYATKATSELAAIMLPDSGHIQEMECEWRQRKAKRAGRDADCPLYTAEDATACCRLFRPVRYDEELRPADDVRVVFRDAGHILGSAILEIRTVEDGRERTTVFSGDLGNKGLPILRDPTAIEGCDTLVVESTYGDRLHDRSVDKVERFMTIVNETIAGGGNVVIPSFAVGRTQEVLYALNQQEEKYRGQRAAFLRAPVYVDSPLAVSATKVFRDNVDCYDEEARAYIANGDNPLDFPNLHFTASAEESKALNASPESKIIISASGMCDAGRIKHHLKHNLWRKDSTVLFVGYQAKGTLGRTLVEGARHVRIFGDEIRVNARIEMIDGFSGHADRDGLLEWIGAMKRRPSEIVLIHGEPDVIDRFSRTIAERFGVPTRIPDFGASFTLGTEVTVQRVLPESARESREAAMLRSSRILDDLLAQIEGSASAVRERLRAAQTDADREEILLALRADLRQRIDAALDGPVQAPGA